MNERTTSYIVSPETMAKIDEMIYARTSPVQMGKGKERDENMRRQGQSWGLQMARELIETEGVPT